MSRVYHSAQGEGDDEPARPGVGPEPANLTARGSAGRRTRRAPDPASPVSPDPTAVAAFHDAARFDAARQEAQRQRGGDTGRLTPSALLAREHELARLRAAHIPGDTAAAELAAQLTFAHRHAGKPSLTKLSLRTRYSKGTLSKVLNGKMTPAWKLVRTLGEVLRVPPQCVSQEWLPLWIASIEYREATKAAQKAAKETTAAQIARGTAAVPPPPAATTAIRAEQTVVVNGVDLLTGTAPHTDALTEETGYACPQCGGWVVNTARHTDWHMRRDPAGKPAPDAESTGAGQANTTELALLKQIFPEPNDAT